MAVIFVFGPEIIGLKAALVRAEGIGETWVAGIHPDIVTAVLGFKDQLEIQEDEDGVYAYSSELGAFGITDEAHESEPLNGKTAWQITKVLDEGGDKIGHSYATVGKDGSLFVDLAVTLDGKDVTFRGSLLPPSSETSKIILDGPILVDEVLTDADIEYSLTSEGALYATSSTGDQMCVEGCGGGSGSGMIANTAFTVVLIIFIIVAIICVVIFFFGWSCDATRQEELNSPTPGDSTRCLA